MKEKGVTTIALKKINRGKVYQYIYQNKATSKQQIVQGLQMGLSTVSQNLAALEQDGLIRKDGFFQSTGGRKAHVIQIVPDFKVSIGVGILKKQFHIVAVDLYGEQPQTEVVPLPYDTSEAYFTEVAARVKQFISACGYKEEQILGVSIATQGIISPDGTTVTYGTVMGNAEMKLSDFAAHLPYPCRLEHDSKAAATLERWNHDQLDSAVIFLLNRNLGGAVITNHRIHQGLSMHSGTIEHICMDPDGPQCYCGQRGCLESYCSATALEQAAGMSIKEFFPLLRAGKSPKLQQIWDAYLEKLATAVRNLNLIIDSPVIFSGYLAPYLTEADLNDLLSRINALTPFPLERNNLLVGTMVNILPPSELRFFMWSASSNICFDPRQKAHRVLKKSIWFHESDVSRR